MTDYGLIDQYLQAQNYEPTTRNAKEAWLKHWCDIVGGPLESMGREGALKLKEEFKKHRGWVPGKYYDALKLYFKWVAAVTEGFKDPTIGVEFTRGEEPATKDALTRDQMAALLEYARKDAITASHYGGRDVIRAAIFNHRTRIADVDVLMDAAERIAQSLLTAAQ